MKWRRIFGSAFCGKFGLGSAFSLFFAYFLRKEVHKWADLAWANISYFLLLTFLLKTSSFKRREMRFAVKNIACWNGSLSVFNRVFLLTSQTREESDSFFHWNRLSVIHYLILFLISCVSRYTRQHPPLLGNEASPATYDDTLSGNLRTRTSPQSDIYGEV